MWIPILLVKFLPTLSLQLWLFYFVANSRCADWYLSFLSYELTCRDVPLIFHPDWLYSKAFFFSLLRAYLANLCRFNSSKLTPQILPLIVQTEDLLFQPWHRNNFAGHYIVFWLVHLTESSVKMCHRYTGKTLDIIYLAHFLNVLCTWSDANKWRKELQRWRVM